LDRQYSWHTTELGHLEGVMDVYYPAIATRLSISSAKRHKIDGLDQ
jgi:hypothetical protein